MPSLKQLNEAIASYRDDHPDALITVVVDATFGHRIDPKEVPEFEIAIETNAFVAPPAGAVGRGDGFILSIAQKAGASILSNDSYQEFHGEYAWLFDEGRLIGGKPVPHVGWVFVNRVPVRGPVSRRSVKEQKIVDKSPRRRGSKSTADLPSISASGPMPVPTSAPPGAVMPGSKPKPGESKAESKAESKQGESRQREAKQTGSKRSDAKRPETQPAADKQAASPNTTNDLGAFFSFVEHYPTGTAVTGVVESYSSHGAYVMVGDIHGYVPLRLMGDPAPRSAREAMELGETVTLVVSSFNGPRRSVDLAVPSMAPVVEPPPNSKPRRVTKKAAAAAPAPDTSAEAGAEPLTFENAHAEPVAAAPAPAKPSRGRATKKQAAASVEASPSSAAADVVEIATAAPAALVAPTTSRRRPTKSAAKSAASAGTSAPAAEPTPVVESAPEPTPAPPAKAAAKKAAPRRAKAGTSAAPGTAAAAAPSLPEKKVPTRRRRPTGGDTA